MKRIHLLLVCSLLCLLITVSAFAFLWALGFPPFNRTVPLAVSTLEAAPWLWVGRRVQTQGELVVGIEWPEMLGHQPYNCGLRDAQKKSFIGVLWQNPEYDLNGENVTVTGILEKERSWFYIHVETVTPSQEATA